MTLDYHPPVKRSMAIDKHQTSISLEPVFWDMLKNAARRRGLAINALVSQIDAERIQSDTPPGLASAIRMWLTAHIGTGQTGISIHLANRADYDALGQIMYDAVHAVPSPYNSAQRNAWMPKPRTGSSWAQRLDKQWVLIAKDPAYGPLGFMSHEPTGKDALGYIDFAYILPQARGTGLFRQLHDRIEAYALGRGNTHLQTHASLAAQPAFAAMGYTVSYEEDVAINGQKLHRFAMEKTICKR